MAMPKKSDGSGKIVAPPGRARVVRYAKTKPGSPPMTNQPRWSPSSAGLRTSPGLLAGHYAGCKFSEPPLPSALPLPPQHWTMMSFCGASQHHDFSQQLKVLLKVQA